MAGSEYSSKSGTRLGSVDKNYYPTVPEVFQASKIELNKFLRKTKKKSLSCLARELFAKLRGTVSFQTSFEMISKQLNDVYHDVKRTFSETPETPSLTNYRDALVNSTKVNVSNQNCRDFEIKNSEISEFFTEKSSKS